MRTKPLILIVLVGSMLILMPAMVFAGGHHGYHGHHGGHGHGHTNFGFSFGLGCFGALPYYYPDYYSSYYSPRVVYIDPPPPAAVQRPRYDPMLEAFKSDLVKKREKELLDKLQQGNDASRLHAIDLLAGFSSDDQVMVAMENVLRYDPNAATRKAIAETFGRVKNQKALEVLETARVKDPDLEVRQAADRAISRIKS